MSKRFGKGLQKAWSKYQELYDRHMGLLRLLGSASGLDEIREAFADEIDYALEEWSTPSERFDTGDIDDPFFIDGETE